ncbi:MAG: hypothetical protein ACRECH_06500 [Nitrososphaerales archaeon]
MKCRLEHVKNWINAFFLHHQPDYITFSVDIQRNLGAGLKVTEHLLDTNNYMVGTQMLKLAGHKGRGLNGKNFEASKHEISVGRRFREKGFYKARKEPSSYTV